MTRTAVDNQVRGSSFGERLVRSLTGSQDVCLDSVHGFLRKLASDESYGGGSDAKSGLTLDYYFKIDSPAVLG